MKTHTATVKKANLILGPSLRNRKVVIGKNGDNEKSMASVTGACSSHDPPFF